MLGFLYVFHIPIDELKKDLRLLAITVLHTPPGQECERETEKDGERNKKRYKKKEGRKGGREERDIKRGAWQEARGA